MRGVIAEAHYDGGRNFITMLRGRKRYVLIPPNECPNLSLLQKGHPSARHSSFDWSNINEIKKHEDFLNVKGTEVVLSRGEMLYIPSFWFHYIISQDASVQCNARSGSSEKGFDDISKCFF
jgi:ribosomal protein L16 Arg81 hydroxylase